MKNALRIYLMSNQEDSHETFNKLGNGTVCETGWSSSIDDAFREIPQGINVLVVELIDSEQQLKTIQSWSLENSDIPVYVITESSDVNDIRHYMRSGARDVFVKPLNADEIWKEMKQVIGEEESKEQGGKLVSFMNVKGGNGCTTIAVNTALEIAKSKQLKTLFVDLDIQFGDAATKIDLKSPGTVMEALSQAERLDASLLTSLVSTSSHGLDVLASPDKLVGLDEIRPDDIKMLMEAAVEVYDLVIFDLPRVITPWVEEIFKWNDHIFLVAQGSVSDVRDGSLLLEHLHTIGASEDSIHFLHNRAGVKHAYASVDSDQLAKSFKTKRLITIRNDYDTAIHSADLGKAVSDHEKHSKLAKDIKTLADLIIELSGYKVEKTEDKDNVFTRLFKKYGGNK
jgi:pilus assembly protein CpaE